MRHVGLRLILYLYNLMDLEKGQNMLHKNNSKIVHINAVQLNLDIWTTNVFFGPVICWA